MRNRRRWLVVGLLLAGAMTAYAQGRRGGWRGGDFSVEENPAYDGRFSFVRVRYQGYGCMSGEGPGWMHDYPIGERNLLKIMSELTALKPRLDSSYVLDLDNPELMRHPIAYLSEPGCWSPSETEVKGLQDYLKKGGFLIFDDFRGGRDWYNLEEAMRRVLPDGQWVQLDVSNPIFQSFFGIESLEIVDERFAARAMFMGIYEENDPKKRLLAIGNFNNDIGDAWQWSAEGFMPVAYTNQAYKLGVNYIMYGFAH